MKNIFTAKRILMALVVVICLRYLIGWMFYAFCAGSGAGGFSQKTLEEKCYRSAFGIVFYVDTFFGEGVDAGN